MPSLFWSSHAFSISHLPSSPALMEDGAGKLPLHHSSKWWDMRKEGNCNILNSYLSGETAEERGNLVLDSNIYFSTFVSTSVFKKSCVCAIYGAFWYRSRDVQQTPWKILIIFKLISQYCDIFWNENRSSFFTGIVFSLQIQNIQWWIQEYF